MRQNPLDFEKPLLELEDMIERLKSFATETGLDLSQGIAALEKDSQTIKKRTFKELTRWNRVGLARHSERPQSADYIQQLIRQPIELLGDKIHGNDAALIGGLGWLGNQPVVFLGQQRGRTIEERKATNFGYMHPEGYRKAKRLMRLAEKFQRPVISFVDTPGAHPGTQAEERGQAMAIAENLFLMSRLKTPIVAVVIGQGGSGGALGIAVADRVLMLQHSIYCVCPPEACSGIIWKDQGEHAPEATEGFKPMPEDLLPFSIIDEIIPEPLEGAHRDPDRTVRRVGQALKRHLNELLVKETRVLLEERYEKFRKIGVLQEGMPAVDAV